VPLQDRDILALVESRVPLVEEPYRWISDRLGCSREQLLSALTDLRGDGAVIRQISGIFDVSAFGYEQSLVTFRVSPEKVDQAGAVVAAHPGVSHAYRRRHQWNLWFTLGVSPTSKLGLEATADILASRAEAEDRMVLPSLKRYKLRVRFASHAANDAAPARVKPGEPLELSEALIGAVRALQKDLPNRMRPFDALARQQRLTTDALLEWGSRLLDAGYMRRYAAVLHHRRAGATANVMAVWNTRDRDVDRIAPAMAQHDSVSHCYLRPTREDWPYGLYTMVHGAGRDQCVSIVNDLADQSQLTDYLLLWTEKEYAKKRLELFSQAEAQWEQQARA
jgi:DNA-binding Lrp family transcriptional regulator